MDPIDNLERALGDALRRPGNDGYEAATRPRNATARQRPVAVVAASDADDVRRAIHAAAEAGLAVAVQATGHGAAGTIDQEVLLIDTGRLETIEVDSRTRVARAGAGVKWADLNAAAEKHGLLGLAGTAPDVAVAGYTFFGGIGWLTRPHGLASASLRRVEYVDGSGEARVADDEDPDALWAFRGGGGVGVATMLELDLFPVEDLWAGFRLWPIDRAESVVSAWAQALGAIEESLTSAIGFLLAPDAPIVPEELRGHRAVHLAAASVSGAAGFAALDDALAGAPPPAADTVGPCGAERLAGIHLDPPEAVPAVGEGCWLTADAPARALSILGTHGLGDEAPLAEMEIRHVATTAATDAPGALTAPPGPFLLHAVGPAPSDEDRAGVERALDEVRDSAAPVDTGRAAASFRDGRTSAPEALPPESRTRLEAIRDRLDPDRRIRYPKAI